MIGQGVTSHRLFPAAAIVALAALVMLRALTRSPMIHDSFWIDWVWADQFNAQLASGNFYPRWLPLSHGGLGSPVFYYYPPLAFHIAGLFGLAGLPTYATILAAFFAGLIFSGFSMLYWLRETNARSPLLGALLFMVMPYHLLDFYGRGALAEFVAIGFIPLVALGVRRAVEGRPLLLAATYAALILTHLPLALLVSLFLIMPYAIHLTRREPKALLRLAAPLAVGLAVAGIYLVPALLLDRYRDASQLWSLATFKAENWTLWRWAVIGPSMALRLVIASILLALSMPILVVLLFVRDRRWAIYAAVCGLLGIGLIPGFWSLPLLESVQYPFRILPLAEFAIATAIARAALPRLLMAVAIVPALAPSAMFILIQPKRPEVPSELVYSSHPDVPENLPPGERPFSWPSRWALEVADAHPALQVGGRTIEPLFYFPAWQVRCNGRVVPTAPDPKTSLLTYRGRGCERRLVTTSAECAGIALSLLGLLGLGLLAVRQRRRGVRE